MPGNSSLFFTIICLLAGNAFGQVVTPMEIKDAGPRLLQEKYLPQLKAVGAGVSALQFPYHFYLSRALGIDERKQVVFQQASIQFDNFEGQSVVQLTGNYFASYSDELMSKNRRARQTFTDVMLPILKVAVPEFTPETPFQSFALEISHHVRGELLGVLTENTENFVMVLPRDAAARLVAAKDPAAQQAALLEARAFLNGDPITVWMSEDPPPESAAQAPFPPRSEPAVERMTTRPAPARKNRLNPQPDPGRNAQQNTNHELPESLAYTQNAAISDNSPQALQRLKGRYGDAVLKMKMGLASEAHFVDYAPPAFIAFRQGTYLQIPVSTNLQGGGASSQYRLAALAFDQHIAHLIRPAMAYFVEPMDFDGIDFSATIHTSDGEGVQSVEFIVPASILRRYEQYDCTGQQLINSSIVLINGERVSLDLQGAEVHVP